MLPLLCTRAPAFCAQRFACEHMDDRLGALPRASLCCVHVRVWSILRLCGYPPFFEDDDQEALFAQIRTGAYEFTSPYWDCVSDDGTLALGQAL
jgi:hypothetical protein